MSFETISKKLHSLVTVEDFDEGSVLRLIADRAGVQLALEVAIEFGGKRADAYIKTYNWSIRNAEDRLKGVDWSEWVDREVAKQTVKNENQIETQKTEEGSGRPGSLD